MQCQGLCYKLHMGSNLSQPDAVITGTACQKLRTIRIVVCTMHNCHQRLNSELNVEVAKPTTGTTAGTSRQHPTTTQSRQTPSRHCRPLHDAENKGFTHAMLCPYSWCSAS
jgi:hypothetical protein